MWACFWRQTNLVVSEKLEIFLPETGTVPVLLGYVLGEICTTKAQKLSVKLCSAEKQLLTRKYEAFWFAPGKSLKYLCKNNSFLCHDFNNLRGAMAPVAPSG